MKIVVAPDSFKESLSAKEVSKNIAKAISEVMPEAEILQVPISDGGEGLLDALIPSLKGTLITTTVKDPLLRNIEATYGIVNNGNTAIIEMAKASGLELLKENEKNPLITSTFGTGQLIKNALNRGCKKIIVGLGGSATNDGGMGMMKALGVAFLDNKGRPINEGGGALNALCKIDLTRIDKRVLNCEIVSACDVLNPLTGSQGASFVYGSQKGAKPEELELLDKNLLHYASIIKSNLKIDLKTRKGTGAAGGMGMALLTFLNAKLIPGIKLIMDSLQIETHIRNADLVITGEGRIDRQTLYGKTITGIASIALKHKVPVIAITGSIGTDIDKIYDMGVHAVFSIVNQPMDLKKSIENADTLVRSCVTNIFRMIKVSNQ